MYSGNMTITEQIILIILSSFLTLFLLLGIIILIKFIQLQNYAKKIMEKAELATDKVIDFSDSFKKAKSSMVLLKVLDHFISHKKKNKSE
jgi:ATP/ADP translocase